MAGYTPKRLRDARKKRGHTQMQAAMEMGVALSTVQMWEGDRREPKGLYMERVCAYIEGGEGD